MRFLPFFCPARLSAWLHLVLATLAASGGAGEGGCAARAPRTAHPEHEPPALAARLELPVPGKPEGLLALDLDGDGRDELLALSKTPGVLTVFRELPSGWSVRSTRQHTRG